MTSKTKAWFVCLLVVSSSNAKSSENANTEEYRTVLQNQYSGFEFVGPVFGPDGDDRSYRRSPDSFVGDILVGDFNFDGIADFAAALIEAGAVQEAQDGGSPSGLAIVCNGIDTQSGSGKYECTPLTELRPHGFRAYIDLYDWTPWLDLLLNRHPVEEDTNCPIHLKKHVDKKLLSIVEPYGHCDTFYYQRIDGSYAGCTYCAD